MKRLLVFGALTLTLIGLFPSSISHTRASIADTSIPDNEVTSSVTEGDNSSASATITITMWTVPDE